MLFCEEQSFQLMSSADIVGYIHAPSNVISAAWLQHLCCQLAKAEVQQRLRNTLLLLLLLLLR